MSRDSSIILSDIYARSAETDINADDCTCPGARPFSRDKK